MNSPVSLLDFLTFRFLSQHIPKEDITMATIEKQGYFPRWSLKTEGIIAPDERLPWGQSILVGLQHVLAMFGATVLAPIIMGFNPNTDRKSTRLNSSHGSIS